MCNYVVMPCGMSADSLNEPKLRMLDMDNWDEVKTALHVARIGTVSGAAEVLGVHHATVIRHIDALEERLGVSCFSVIHVGILRLKQVKICAALRKPRRSNSLSLHRAHVGRAIVCRVNWW